MRAAAFKNLPSTIDLFRARRGKYFRRAVLARRRTK